MLIASLVTPGSVPESVLFPSPALHGHGASPNIGPVGASVAGVVVSAAEVSDAESDVTVSADVAGASVPALLDSVGAAVVGAAVVGAAVVATAAGVVVVVVDLRSLPHEAAMV